MELETACFLIKFYSKSMYYKYKIKKRKDKENLK